MTPLRQRMLEDMSIRNLAQNTQAVYLQQIVAYARHFQRSPEELGPEEVRAYQVHLTQTRMLSPSSVSVATGALRFLYKVTLKRDLGRGRYPDAEAAIPATGDSQPRRSGRFLAAIDSLKHQTLLMTTYAAGLRISEATHLQGHRHR